MASSSSKKYDVFISFRGSDVRQGFLSHLHKAFLVENIEAFVDEQLERGEQISESLLGIIEESHISIVIFSHNYAYSEWCLEELLKIDECRNSAGQTVIPVFYGVDPSHVQDLTGSYGDAVAQHRTKFNESMVESWGRVLKETASLSGLVSANFKTESNLIEEIVKQTLDKLNYLYPSDSSCDGGLVGINARVEKVLSLLCGSEDVFVVGIWGEGGIGKTTLARAVFDRICSQFDGQCFFGNVREKSEKSTADAIQNEVVSSLFGTSNSNMTRKRLSRKKVILVLDDVSDLDQIKSLLRHKRDFGSGSRIVVTSRDSHLLKILGAKIYEVEKLDDHEALQRFCLNAFGKKVPEEGYLELSERAVEYAQGLPLALEVLGSNLFQRCAEEWEDELEKLKGTSDQKIHKILRISYDGLPDLEKELFLDIACFLKGRRRDEVESMLDVRGSKIGISRLAEKALISIWLDDSLQMHDLIEQMAKDIICKEKTLEKRKWLWDPEEIYFLLTREMGTEYVRGISLDISKIKNMNLSPTAFLKLYNLRYLHFYSSIPDNAQLSVPQGLEYLPEQLRYLHWDQYPSKSLPMFSSWAEKLVELNMFHCELEELWNGVPNLPNLKSVYLFGFTKLTKVPDLSRASNLERLVLSGCSRLESLPVHICDLKSLSDLSVSDCGNLHGLPQNVGSLESLESLDASGSGLKELPESVCNLTKLTRLNVYKCANLRRVPDDLGNLKSLKELWTSGLNGLPQNFGNLESLEMLYVNVSGIKEVPSYNNLRELRELTQLWRIDLTNCGVSEFPIGLCSVTSLVALYLGGNNFESIPESIKHLSKLQTIDLHDCKKLKCLPESIKLLPLGGSIDLRDCATLDQNQCSKIINQLVMEYSENTRGGHARIRYPGSEVAEKMKHKNESGPSLSFSFQLLEDVEYAALQFYACVVLDRTMYDGKCKGNFIDESGLSFCVEAYTLTRADLTIRPRHVFLQEIRFRSKNFVKGRKYTAELQFLCLTAKPDKDVDEYIDDDPWSSDGIIKCGTFPLFHHQTVQTIK